MGYCLALPLKEEGAQGKAFWVRGDGSEASPTLDGGGRDRWERQLCFFVGVLWAV